MVLEAIVVPESWEQHPRRMLIIGFAYATVGIFMGMWVFGKYASIAGIFLTTIPLVVIMYRAINCEEEKDLRICREYLLIKEHIHILMFFIYLFVGIVLSYTFWFSLMPEDTVNWAYSSQVETIGSIRSQFAASGAAASKTQYVGTILSNNIRVLAFCILFSIIYGAGAIFILTWNASVIGVAVGSVVREWLMKVGAYGQNVPMLHYFSVIPSVLAYFVHGIPEVTSYFLGSLAGGIISVAVACHHYRSKEFWHIIRDSLDLTILSVIVLVAAAYIEVYVTPLIL